MPAPAASRSSCGRRPRASHPAQRGTDLALEAHERAAAARRLASAPYIVAAGQRFRAPRGACRQHRPGGIGLARAQQAQPAGRSRPRRAPGIVARGKSAATTLAASGSSASPRARPAAQLLGLLGDEAEHAVLVLPGGAQGAVSSASASVAWPVCRWASPG